MEYGKNTHYETLQINLGSAMNKVQFHPLFQHTPSACPITFWAPSRKWEGRGRGRRERTQGDRTEWEQTTYFCDPLPALGCNSLAILASFTLDCSLHHTNHHCSFKWSSVQPRGLIILNWDLGSSKAISSGPQSGWHRMADGASMWGLDWHSCHWLAQANGQGGQAVLRTLVSLKFDFQDTKLRFSTGLVWVAMHTLFCVPGLHPHSGHGHLLLIDD